MARATKTKKKTPTAKKNGRITAKKTSKKRSAAGSNGTGRRKAAPKIKAQKISTKLKKEIEAAFQMQKEHSLVLRNSTAEDRKAMLKRLLTVVDDYRSQTHEALKKDMGRSAVETDLAEYLLVRSEIKDAIRNVKKWMKPNKVRTPISMMGSSSQVVYEPKGTSLIIAPWNYPFQLAIAPLAAAIAAGCTAIIKPSEMTPHTSALIKRMIADAFSPEEVTVFEGDASVAATLTSLEFDHIFFTGSPGVGRKVMEAAARNLASVTLELGGKSPVFIDGSVDLQLAASRIMWGKIFNAGQTCVAPDYIMMPADRIGPFVEEAKKAVTSFLGDKVEASPDYCRIVNAAHHKRLTTIIDDTVKKGGKLEFGGQTGDNNFLAPTLITGAPANSLAMQEEIFGPVLPIVAYETIDQAINYVNAGQKPLALYVFTKHKKFADHILKRTSAGGSVINDTVIHFAHPKLPAGGVNNSGIGNYHGEWGFKAFSHERAIMKQGRFSAISNMYPPYNKFVKKMVDITIKWLT